MRVAGSFGRLRWRRRSPLFRRSPCRHCAQPTPISESFWVPFRLTSSSYPPLEGPPVRTFGRLAPDANLEGAQVELTTVTQPVVLGNPETHRQLRAQVLPFPNEVMDISRRSRSSRS